MSCSTPNLSPIGSSANTISRRPREIPRGFSTRPSTRLFAVFPHSTGRQDTVSLCMRCDGPLPCSPTTNLPQPREAFESAYDKQPDELENLRLEKGTFSWSNCLVLLPGGKLSTWRVGQTLVVVFGKFALIIRWVSLRVHPQGSRSNPNLRPPQPVSWTDSVTCT